MFRSSRSTLEIRLGGHWPVGRPEAGLLSPRYQVNAPRTWMTLAHSLDTQRLARENT
jgi:hypothetical protein